MINFYDAEGKFVKGETYVLFAEFFESVFYDEAVYHSVYDIFVEVDKNMKFERFEILGNDALITDENLFEDLEKYIVEVDDGLRTDKSTNGNKIIKSDDVNVLIESSEYICIVKPTAIIIENEVAKTVNSKVIKNYKAKLKEEIIVQLPANAEVEKEYLVFLSKTDGGSYVINSQHSFVSKEILNKLEK